MPKKKNGTVKKKQNFDSGGHGPQHFHINPENFEDIFSFFGFQRSPFNQNRQRKNQAADHRDVRASGKLRMHPRGRGNGGDAGDCSGWDDRAEWLCGRGRGEKGPD